MKAALWRLIHKWRDATTTEAAWIARDQIDIELDKIEAAATQEPVMIYEGRCIFDCGDGGHQDVTMLKMIPKGAKLYRAAGAAPVHQEPAPKMPSDRILSFQIKRAIQAEDALHAAQKEIEHLKSKPKLTDAQILVLWEQTYVQRGTSGIEFARAVLALAAGSAPVQHVFGGRVDPSYVSGPMQAAPKEPT